MNTNLFKEKYLDFLFFSAYALLVISGLIKWIIPGSVFPIVLAFILIVLSILKLNQNNSWRLAFLNKSLFFPFLFFLYFILSSFYTISDNYYWEKILRVLQIGLVFSLPIIYIRSNNEQVNLEKVLKFLSIITIIAITYILFTPQIISLLVANKRDNIPDYISVGEWVLLIYILVLSSPKLLHVFSSIILFYFLLQVGGRGNVLIATLITSIYFIVWVINKNKKRVVFFAIIVLMIIANFYFNKANSFSDRITPLTSFKLDQSLSERYVFAQNSLEFFSEKPIFGNGIGSFGTLFGFGDERAYPHNIFLEIAVECGLIGLVLIICVFLCVFKDLWHTANSFRLTMFLILLAFIGSLQYTNTFTESKIAFASFGIIQAYLNNYKREFIV